MKGVSSLSQALRIACVITVVLFAVLPVFWQALTSLKGENELVNLPPLLPSTLHLEHYRTVLFSTDFLISIQNSFLVAVFTTLLSVSVGSLAAFALVQLEFPFRRSVLGLALLAAMFPTISLISPLFLVVNNLGLRDSIAGPVLLYSAFTTPLAVWILSDLFRAIPRELFSAARIDGCSILQCYLKVVLPLALPGIAATAILVFLYAWNEFLFALIFTATSASRTVPVAVSMFTGVHEIPWGEIAAASILALLPAALFVLLFQRQIVDGLTAGAVKG